MDLGMVGLGRMGANMTRRLTAAGHRVVAYDRDAEVVAALAAEHDAIERASSLVDLVDRLDARRVVWVMVPAGSATAATLEELFGLLEPGDIVANGGNCKPSDSQGYAQAARQAGVVHLDAGVSGGVWGLEHGYCLMIGGPAEAYGHAEPIFAALAPSGGYARVGDEGAGHFAKMVHNGIEYALLQSYAEGFALLEASEHEYDLAALAELWRHGSVVRSWLLDLVADVLDTHKGDLSAIEAHVEDSGEGRWTVKAAVDHAVATPAIAAALFARFSSRQDAYGDRLIAALRGQFGGHAVKRTE